MRLTGKARLAGALLLATGFSGGILAQTAILEIREGNLRRRVGEAFQLHVNAVPRISSSQDLVWTSSAPAIASIDQGGRVTALSPGSALVSVRHGSSSDTVVVSVFPATAVILDPLPASPPVVHAWSTEALRERAPVGPPEEKPALRILAERWIELWLPERPFDPRRVDDQSLYSIGSPDDPNYAHGVAVDERRPVRIQHRFFPER
ncbi:MAG: Ig-like domain-containing protein, partial [Spirochaetota bacterium]